ncbi:hypothetical protein [Paenibacillus kandeliae]|uniref:hypothetical protein n=1 Tax=Paenibacillus kandeliae TaxID=3231269 RepID=UPI00345741AA
MKSATLEGIIQKYRGETGTVYQTRLAEYEAEKQKLRNMNQEIKQLNHLCVEKEVISYVLRNLIEAEWKNADDWIGAIVYHPSSIYLDYLFKILRVVHKNGPYYWVLNVIQCLPEELADPILPELKTLADPINPAWTASDIEKYFETIVWMDEDAEQFCLSLANSPSELVVQRVNYWLENFEADRLEELEDEE